MEDQKEFTFRKKREQHNVSQQVKDHLKEYNAIRKRITEAMGDDDCSIPELAQKIGMTHSETLYYMMSMLKFGQISCTGIDDMDEFYLYKIVK